MKENISKSIIWNKAGYSGLILGLVSTAYMFLTQLMGNLQPSGMAASFGLSALAMILWAVKFGLCIWLMSHFMRRQVNQYQGVTNSDTFLYGVATALFSALIYSAFNLANLTLISPGLIESKMQEVVSQMGSMMDSNSRETLANMSASMPAISFFSNLIYCFLFGVILSSILSRNIPARDIFSDFNNPQDNQENIDNQ